MKKEKNDFLTSRNTLFELYFEGNYKEGFKLSEILYKNFPDKITDTAFWVACFSSLTKNRDRAIKVLNESLDKGIWWSPAMILGETDFNFIKEEKEFKDIVERCMVLFEKAQKKTKPECLIFTPKTFDTSGTNKLFMAIHFRGSRSEDFSRYFKKIVLERNYILAVPQSSQLYAVDRYCWDDRDLAKKELQKHYDELKKTYRLNENEIIIAGASQGGSLSIEMVLGENNPGLKKFVSIIPGIRYPSSYHPLLQNGVKKGAKGAIISGEKDFNLQGAKDVYKEAEKIGFPCKFIIMERVGHEMPDNFDRYFTEAINFVE
jgi:predicted esterase